MKSTETKKRSVAKYILLTLLCFILILAMAGYGYFQSKYQQIYSSAEVQIDPNADYEELVDADPGQVSSMELMTENLEEKESVEATDEVVSHKKVFNVLLIGTDECSEEYSENARGDACMLLSVNTAVDPPMLSLLSFERGIGVPILDGEYAGQYDWLTHTFRYGGAELMMREISECFKIEVDYYVRVNFSAFEKGIDAIGGVDVYMDESEAQYFIENNYMTDPVVGMNHLDGKLALNYVRLRAIDSDWVRIQRQREVVLAAAEKCRGNSLADWNRLIDEIVPLVKTNVPETKLVELLLLLPSFADMQMQQATIPQEGTYGSMQGMGGRSMFAVDFEANHDYLQQLLYPHTEQ